MIQFNLLPDVKLEYIRARRSKHMIVLISVAVTAAALAVLILLFLAVNVFQKKHLGDLNRDVSTLTKELKDTPDLNKILTIQNQLINLPELHDKKPVVTRLYGYIGQVTPAQISISKLDIDFATSTINVTGAADSINTINTFIDTLKFTNYSVGDSKETTKAFSSVVLLNFGRDDKGASYQTTFKFDPLVFDVNTDVKLHVPKQITTRSETEKPGDLFQPNSNTKAP